jgi:hypothetical protein
MNDLSPVFPQLNTDDANRDSAGNLLAARYRDRLPEPGTWNDTLSVILSHR